YGARRRSVDGDVAGLGVDGDLLLIGPGGEVELVLDHAVVVLELPAAQLAVDLRRGLLEGVVVGHRVLEVHGLLLVVGLLALVGDHVAADRVDDDLVIGGAGEDLHVPLPGGVVLVVVELDRVEDAVADLLLRGLHGVRGGHRRGVGAQVGVGAVVVGGGIAAVVGRTAVVAAVIRAAVVAAVIRRALVGSAVVGVAGRGVGSVGVGVAVVGGSAAGGSQGEHRAGGERRRACPESASNGHADLLSPCPGGPRAGPLVIRGYARDPAS